MVFVDGENLLLRFEAMLADGYVPRTDMGTHLEPRAPTVHSPNRFVWNPSIPREIIDGPLIRVNYYTTASGDSISLEALEDDIANQYAHLISGTVGSLHRTLNATRLVPRVFKKQKNGTKTKSVDINICVDVLTQAYQSSVDDLFIVSGDGDYAPLIRQAMSTGKRVHVAALSSGLSPIMGRISDHFVFLDNIMFDRRTKQ